MISPTLLVRLVAEFFIDCPTNITRVHPGTAPPTVDVNLPRRPEAGGGIGSWGF
jgi:hypothetical protein